MADKVNADASNEISSDKNDASDVERKSSSSREFFMNSMRKNMLGSLIYQLLYPVIIIGLIYIIAHVLRLDLMHPYLSLGNAPVLLAFSFVILGLLALQLVYLIIMPKVDGKPVGRVIGYIVAIGMLLSPPTGTYFGVLLLQYLAKPEVGGRLDLASDDIELEARKGLGNGISFSGLLMLHQPMILIILNVILLTLPLDMAHPIITSDLYAKWDVFAYTYLVLFLVQIVVGVLYKKFGEQDWMKAVAVFFAVFMISSFAIAVQALMLKLGPGLELGDSSWILYLGWIIGLLLNPLGLYFGIMVIKGMMLEIQLEQSAS